MKPTLAFALLASSSPVIQDETADCFKSGDRPLICAHVMDERAVASARVFFRSRDGKGFYWAELSFDGARYCATLPRPSAETRVEYYLEAVNDGYETARTRSRSLEARSGCRASTADPQAPPTVVHTTVPQQDPVPAGFDPRTLKPFTPAPGAAVDRPAIRQ